MNKKSGFILLIVVGILGILAALAVQMVGAAGVSKNVSQIFIDKARARLVARSGIDLALAEISARDLIIDSFKVERSILGGEGYCVVSVDGIDGRININDGIAGGTLTLGANYDASEYDPNPGVNESGLIYEGTASLPFHTGLMRYRPTVPGLDMRNTLNGNTPHTFEVLDGPLAGWSYTFSGGWNAPGSNAFAYRWMTIGGYPQVSSTPTIRVQGQPKFYPNKASASGEANIRLRRILNAYGDVHKFVSDMGWPTYFDSQTDPFTSQPFVHTSTCEGHRHISIPARDAAGIAMPRFDSVGNIVTSRTDVVASSSGLGDRVIAGRTATGFKAVDEISQILDTWGSQFLSVGYLGGKSFSEIARSDLGVESPEDKDYMRVTKEPSPYKNSTLPGVGDVWSVTDIDYFPRPVMTIPFDMTDLFERHPVALINLNLATDHVRAATFYALANVSYIGESINMTGDAIKFVDGGGQTGIHGPLHGVAGVCFSAGRLKENGVLTAGNVQKSRFMSLRDAMSLGQAYQHYTDNVAKILDEDEFRDFLVWYETNGREYERAKAKGATYTPTPSDSKFTQDYVASALPYFLSPLKRMPGFLGAPTALTSPYKAAYQLGDGSNPVRKAEDFVRRIHLPKVSYISHGVVEIRSEGFLQHPKLDHEINTTVRIYRRKALRSQKDFLDAVITQSSNINIGPEPLSIDPAEGLGFVGLWDQESAIIGTPRISLQYNKGAITHGFDADPGGAYHRYTLVEQDPHFVGHSLYSNYQTSGPIPVTATRHHIDNGVGLPHPSPFGGGRFTSWKRDSSEYYLNKAGQTVYWNLEDKSASVPMAARSTFNGSDQMWNHYGKGHFDCWFKIPNFAYTPGAQIHTIAQFMFLDQYQTASLNTNNQALGITIGFEFDPSGRYKIVAIMHEESAQASQLWDGTMIPTVPFANNEFMGLCLEDGSFYKDSRVWLRRDITLKDTPENGSGSWHRISVGWDLNPSKMQTPTAESAFWLKLRDLANQQGSTQFSRGVLPSPIGLGWNKGFFKMAYHETNALMLGEIMNDLVNYKRINYFESVIDNVQIHFGSMPTSPANYDFSCTAYGDPGFAQDKTIRYDVSANPYAEFDMDVPVGARLVYLKGSVFNPPDENDNFPSCEVRAIDGGVEIAPTSTSPSESTHRYLDMINTSFRAKVSWMDHAPTFDGDLNTNKMLKLDSSDCWTEIPWLVDLQVIYVPKGGVKILSWSEN